MRENLRWHSVRGTWVRWNQNKSIQYQKQVTGDTAAVLAEHYSELTRSDLVNVHLGLNLGGGA